MDNIVLFSTNQISDILKVSNKTVIYIKEFPLDRKLVENQRSCDISGYNYFE